MLKNENYRLEWCIDDAITALPHFDQVDQVEWCSRLDLDGLTPDFTLAQQVITQSPVPVKVMLRNRAG
jgi:copper homeostasis protein CutC